MKEQIIQLEPHDDIVSVRDKLGWIRAPRVLLVFPSGRGQKILRDKLDLILLQREVTRKQANLALITRDPVVIEHARELGIPAFRSIDASRKKYWRTTRAQLDVSRLEPDGHLEADALRDGSRLKSDQPALVPRKAQQVLALTIISILIASILAGLFYLVPGAEVYLSPATNQVTVSSTITADPGIDVQDLKEAVIRARILGVEVSGTTTVDVTGSRSVPAQKARGLVLLTNLIPDQVTVSAGTIVRTSAAQPVRFVTLVDITLPGQVGATVEVPIEALDAGFEGNLPSERINQLEGPLSARVGVTNEDPTRGGGSQEVPSVSQEDVDRARALLLQQLQQRAFAEMQARMLLDTEFVPLESLSVVLTSSELYSPAIGEPAENLTLSLRVTVQGIAIDERQAREVVYVELANKIGSGYQIGSDSLTFTRGDVLKIDEERRVIFVMHGSGNISTAINPREVSELIAGRTKEEARLQLERELPLARPPEIKTWPGFWPFAPALPVRIKVIVDGQL